ncbi:MULTISPECIES: hypothetical protein [unclassified Streptomyces]|uniref:hypothetical protein n=1 Tax=unclassified Streptomyces TaxID=2593676 RepID=UPI00236601D1|nr:MULTISPECIES: hypothetical protein [unclassified Streptomyces]MDF3149064.1 hypothetical protein [Streptomyces sp. T21Q-yed]WDF35629.1 hypothetical protein PBV52_01815 [Streptomyces sp. T12]
MADDRRAAQDKTGEPVPRDLPDQQANPGEDPGEDPWEVPVERADDSTEADDVPDTDEAGTGRQGAARSGTVQPEEHPVPEEPSG